MKIIHYRLVQYRFLIAILTVVLIGIGIASCTNDNLVELSNKIKSGTQAPDTTSTSGNTSSTGTTSGTGATTGTGSTMYTVSFLSDIKPILAKYNCASCHGNNYISYSGVSSLAKSGRLYGTMSGASGYRRMPPGSKTTSTELTLISNWIKEGTPNN